MRKIGGVKMYNTDDLVRELGVNRRTIMNLRAKGELKWIQAGHERLTSEPNLRAFLNGDKLDKLKARESVAKVLENLK